MANHNLFIHNIGLNENNSLSHLLETICPDMEDESNIIEQSKYYDDTDFKEMHCNNITAKSVFLA